MIARNIDHYVHHNDLINWSLGQDLLDKIICPIRSY